MGSPRLPFVALALGVSVCGLPLAAPAQDFQTPSHISYAEGSVRVEREGASEEPGAGWVLLPGDRIRTAAGRVEILFPDGSALAVDEYTVLDILDAALLRLNAGRTILTVTSAEDPSSALRYQLDTPSSSISTEGPGEYRVDVASFPSGVETELSVVHGYAVIENERSSVRVRPGEQSTGAPGLPAVVSPCVQRRSLRRLRAMGRRAARRAPGLWRRLELRSVPPGRSPDVRRNVRQLRVVAAGTVLWLRLVSEGRTCLASVLPRLLAFGPGLWLDVDRDRPLGVADPPLRPMGSCSGTVVLGARSALGTGVGIVGRGAGLRGLVPAGVQQPAGVRDVGLGRQSMEWMGRRAAGAIRGARCIRPPRSGVSPLIRNHAVCDAGVRSGRGAARGPAQRSSTGRRRRRGFSSGFRTRGEPQPCRTAQQTAAFDRRRSAPADGGIAKSSAGRSRAFAPVRTLEDIRGQRRNAQPVPVLFRGGPAPSIDGGSTSRACDRERGHPGIPAAFSSRCRDGTVGGRRQPPATRAHA